MLLNSLHENHPGITRMKAIVTSGGVGLTKPSKKWLNLKSQMVWPTIPCKRIHIDFAGPFLSWCSLQVTGGYPSTTRTSGQWPQTSLLSSWSLMVWSISVQHPIISHQTDKQNDWLEKGTSHHWVHVCHSFCSLTALPRLTRPRASCSYNGKYELDSTYSNRTKSIKNKLDKKRDTTSTPILNRL